MDVIISRFLAASSHCLQASIHVDSDTDLSRRGQRTKALTSSLATLGGGNYQHKVVLMRNLVSFLTILALSWPCEGATNSNGSRNEIIGDEAEIDSVRRRAQAIPACNEVIELVTVSQISQMLTDITEREGPNALRALLATFSQS